MNKIHNFDHAKRNKALDLWHFDCNRRMALRFPKIDFDANYWPIKTLYKTSQSDWHFTKALNSFSEKDESYRIALRCLVAEMVIDGKPKSMDKTIRAFRGLSAADAYSLFDLTLQDLRAIESGQLARARENHAAAGEIQSNLSQLAALTVKLASKGVLPRFGFNVQSEISAELRNFSKARRNSLRQVGSELLDRKIEALNEAMNALIENDPRLDSLDRVAICTLIRELCAPSRINEVLCSSIDDHVSVEDYVQKPPRETDEVHRAHQMLLVTMKGSKGAEWSAKPVLNFMIDAFHYANDVILESGKRSRMLVEWYQNHPNTLYLPPSLEYLRGKSISRKMLAKIINLTEEPPPGAEKSAAKTYFNELKNKCFTGHNPNLNSQRGLEDGEKAVVLVAWGDIEEFLLNKVKVALSICRKATPQNHYNGDLSKMLYLFDRRKVPYLPFANSYVQIYPRLKRTEYQKKNNFPISIFEKLEIFIPINGRVQIAEIYTHDPRRWLTTTALRHGEKLSEVLINKWANRSKLAQLKAYDFRTPKEIAVSSCMPQTPELIELSNGLTKAQNLEDEFGLKTAIVTVHSAGISVTSMDLISQAVEDRPVARTSRGIIIVYPQRFGICLHQHHETPCRNYSNSCLPCNESVVVKGHIPTNDAIRERDGILFKAIVCQLETLAETHNRGIADDQDALAAHMSTLVKHGFAGDKTEQVASDLIRSFHEIKHLIKDKLLANRLHEAFVANGYVQILDDPDVAKGALLKYHNPTQHAAPGLEMALDAHGGRSQIELDEKTLVEQFPLFAPKDVGLKDERHLLEIDDIEDKD